MRENVRAQLRVIIKRILRKYGYPPDKQEKATLTVLEQVELLGWEMAAKLYCASVEQSGRLKWRRNNLAKLRLPRRRQTSWLICRRPMTNALLSIAERRDRPAFQYVEGFRCGPSGTRLKKIEKS